VCVEGLALEGETVVRSTVLRSQASRPRAVIPEGAFCGYTTTRLLGIFSATGTPTKPTKRTQKLRARSGSQRSTRDRWKMKITDVEFSDKRMTPGVRTWMLSYDYTYLLIFGIL